MCLLDIGFLYEQRSITSKDRTANSRRYVTDGRQHASVAGGIQAETHDLTQQLDPTAIATEVCCHICIALSSRLWYKILLYRRTTTVMFVPTRRQ